MLLAAVNKDFGVLAVDSSGYNTELGRFFFQQIKLFYTDRFLIAYSGTHLYTASIKREKFGMDLMSLIIYLENYLKNEKLKVEKMLKSELADKNMNDVFSLWVLGIHKKLPTVVQFNSDAGFKPRYLYSDGKIKFSTSDVSIYMQALLDKQKEEIVMPGMVAEILSRGIYKKAETDKGKRIGGMINAAAILSSGQLLPLSGSMAA